MASTNTLPQTQLKGDDHEVAPSKKEKRKRIIHTQTHTLSRTTEQTARINEIAY